MWFKKAVPSTTAENVMKVAYLTPTEQLYNLAYLVTILNTCAFKKQFLTLAMRNNHTLSMNIQCRFFP